MDELKSDILAKHMVEIVYPKLFELMSLNNIDEIVICLNGMTDQGVNRKSKKTFDLDSNGLHCDTGSKLNVKSCPVQKNLRNTKKIYLNPIDMYVAWCNTVVNKIEELADALKRIDETIKRIESISIIYERSILFEKVNII